jgi:hypothetical protein
MREGDGERIEREDGERSETDGERSERPPGLVTW